MKCKTVSHRIIVATGAAAVVSACPNGLAGKTRLPYPERCHLERRKHALH